MKQTLAAANNVESEANKGPSFICQKFSLECLVLSIDFDESIAKTLIKGK